MTGWRVALGMTVWTYVLVDLFVTGEISLSGDIPRRKPPYSVMGSNALERSVLMDRQERLQLNCEEVMRMASPELENLKPKDFRNILVDEAHELLYCYVPKVACTNWKRVLMIATGKWPGSDPLEIPANLTHAPGTFLRLSNFSMPEIEQKLATYDALIAVRHPLERLLSAYRNKLETRDETSSKYFQTRFGRKIVKRYRKNATRESLRKGDDVTFGEFVDFITDDNNGTTNEHWRPVSELCLPCIVNYNLISKYETLVEDATEVLERIGTGYISFPSKPTGREPTEKKLEDYYSRLSFKQLRKLAEFYRIDLKLFDYSMEDVLGFSLA
ncbi:carbohydrate sulfotransferase 11 [Diachasma alloeum]|uniref:carbohydrate sulfotransferase 11 n=1 Tax=Diachasma alloeum TaxID=454923 RepID=UPI0007384BB1|nr:carbohydrate sulfotransferase 11 [Diachasma alloeum]XP_015123863.1 carbohydrate sulfotransferase 11 [Diachasma alloeum]XP_015123864.1 carbohydrate sulfotransferase 11 [Diachasma alloeum]